MSDSVQHSPRNWVKLGLAHEPGSAQISGLGPGVNQRTNMKTIKVLLAVFTLLAIGTMVGCWGNSAKSPDVTGSIRKALDQAGYKAVSVVQDRDKGIVTLGGQVASENDKSQAETLAKSFAGGQVVADQVAVIPAGEVQEAKAMNSDLDQGIEKNRSEE